MSKTAIVAGSTGLVGSELIQVLAASQEFEAVTALVRKGSNCIYDGVFTVEVDFDNLWEFREDLKGDDIFCCLGTTMKKAGSKESFRKVDFSYALELAKIAEKNGSSRFHIITAAGANSKSFFFYNRVKGEVERAISRLDIAGINIYRPSLLLGNRQEKRIGEKIGASMAKILDPLMIGKLKRYRGIDAKIVARAMHNVSKMDIDGIHIFESERIRELGNA